MKTVGYLTPLTYLQLALMAILLLVLIDQAFLPATEPEPLPVNQTITASQPSSLPALSDNEFEIEQFEEISERPLFYSTRRPQEISTAMTATRSPKRTPQQDWTLTGIILNGDKNIALFSAIRKKKNESLRHGMKLGDWTLDQINPESVRFTKEGRKIEMQLIKPSPSRAQNSGRSSSLFINQSQYGKVVRPME